MSFDWNEYAKLAEELRDRNSEASLRSAVSRIYYSVYHNARDYLLDQGFQLSTFDSSHKLVWNEYKGMGGKSCRAVGMNGDRLSDNRKKADYENEVKDIKQLADESFRFATYILTYLEQCKASRTS